jgi:YD repeat-containing protein
MANILNRILGIEGKLYNSGTNGIGQRTGMVDESGTYTFGYNGRGRLTSRAGTIGGMNYTLSRTYTPGGRVSSMTYPTGRTINYYRNTCACKVDSITTTYVK